MTGADQSSALDGSAGAGAFAEVFGIDVTRAIVTCDSCGHRGAFAEKRAYIEGPGVTVRCPACAQVLARVVRTPADIWVDLRGSASWRIPVEA